MVDERYSLSFTTSSIRQQESLKLAILYIRYKDWRLVRSDVIERNILQQRTTTSSKKLFQELSSRLRHLSDAEINYLAECPESEKSIMLWVANCRRYRFIRDFTIEVLWENQRNLINQ
ncbi:MAG: DUF1819 family protein [Anaerolineae bacterium]|nr:DUF1819 family protein [Anaerolineae bacterium]